MPQIVAVDDFGQLALGQQHLLYEAGHRALPRAAEPCEPEQAASLLQQAFLLQAPHSPCIVCTFDLADPQMIGL